MLAGTVPPPGVTCSFVDPSAGPPPDPDDVVVDIPDLVPDA